MNTIFNIFILIIINNLKFKSSYSLYNIYIFIIFLILFKNIEVNAWVKKTNSEPDSDPKNDIPTYGADIFRPKK
jgi:hypothetical protein